MNSNDLCKYGKTAPYRAPEILCHAFQCMRPPADLWSTACVIFELFAGTLLFDPHQSNTYSARSTGSADTSKELNKQQLSLMIELLGKFPRRFALQNRDFFNRKGDLKDVGPIKTIDLRAIMVVECDIDANLANDLLASFFPCSSTRHGYALGPRIFLSMTFFAEKNMHAGTRDTSEEERQQNVEAQENTL